MYRFKLSKGSLTLLHLAALGHVWRDDSGVWMASTVHTKRNVDTRVKKLVAQGLLLSRFDKYFPEVTELGKRYLKDHPVADVMQVGRLT